MTALLMLGVILALIAKGIMFIANKIKSIDPGQAEKIAGDAREGFNKTMNALSNIRKNHFS